MNKIFGLTKYEQKSKGLIRPQLPMNLFEKRLSNVESEILDARFTEAEIKQAIWVAILTKVLVQMGSHLPS